MHRPIFVVQKEKVYYQIEEAELLRIKFQLFKMEKWVEEKWWTNQSSHNKLTLSYSVDKYYAEMLVSICQRITPSLRLSEISLHHTNKVNFILILEVIKDRLIKENRLNFIDSIKDAFYNRLHQLRQENNLQTNAISQIYQMLLKSQSKKLSFHLNCLYQMPKFIKVFEYCRLNQVSAAFDLFYSSGLVKKTTFEYLTVQLNAIKDGITLSCKKPSDYDKSCSHSDLNEYIEFQQDLSNQILYFTFINLSKYLKKSKKLLKNKKLLHIQSQQKIYSNKIKPQSSKMGAIKANLILSENKQIQDDFKDSRKSCKKPYKMKQFEDKKYFLDYYRNTQSKQKISGKQMISEEQESQEFQQSEKKSIDKQSQLRQLQLVKPKINLFQKLGEEKHEYILSKDFQCNQESEQRELLAQKLNGIPEGYEQAEIQIEIQLLEDEMDKNQHESDKRQYEVDKKQYENLEGEKQNNKNEQNHLKKENHSFKEAELCKQGVNYERFITLLYEWCRQHDIRLPSKGYMHPAKRVAIIAILLHAQFQEGKQWLRSQQHSFFSFLQEAEKRIKDDLEFIKTKSFTKSYISQSALLIFQFPAFRRAYQNLIVADDEIALKQLYYKKGKGVQLAYQKALQQLRFIKKNILIRLKLLRVVSQIKDKFPSQFGERKFSIQFNDQKHYEIKQVDQDGDRHEQFWEEIEIQLKKII